MILCCFDVVANFRLLYINLHVQSETPNLACRKSNQSFSAARPGMEEPARFGCGLLQQTVVVVNWGRSQGRQGPESSTYSESRNSGDPWLMGPRTLQLLNK